MKLLCFVDLHGDVRLLKKIIKKAGEKDIDAVIVAGDFTRFENNLRYFLKKFDSVGKKFLIIPGNHESEKSLKGAIKDYQNCVYLHEKALKFKDHVFLGYGEGGFSLEDPEFRKLARDWYGEYQKEKVILVLHGPPFGTNIDRINNRHVGNKDFRSFIERIKPKLVICGHIHETAGKQDKIGKTIVINPGWDGKVIEVD